METDKVIVMWAVRAVADLAANNPNNQTKLGLNGACEGLILVLKSVLVASNDEDASESMDEITRTENINLAKWSLWAVGNIIQLGRGTGGLIMDDDVKKSTGHTARSVGPQKNTNHLVEAGAAEVVTKVFLQYAEYDSEVSIYSVH